MRTKLPERLEYGRIRRGEYRSMTGDLHGAFEIVGPNGRDLVILSSGSDSEHGWEHVSVSLKSRTPNWDEMCFVKNLFWDEDEVVIQYHPARAEYVSHHPHCLHLWRPIDGELPTPPSHLVGPKA